MEPSQLVFWGAMSVAVGAGLLVAYPVNVWLVAKGLKHGMGTTRALGKGGHSLAAEIAAWLNPSKPTSAAFRMPGMEGM